MERENQGGGLGEPGLFGWVPRGPRGKGRPQHEATARNRNKVMVLLGVGKTTGQIANALGVTEPTLRKHYFWELKTRDMARDALEAELVMSLYEQAVTERNVGAMKQMQARLDRADMAARARAAAGDGGTPKLPSRPVAKGKKEQARNEAADLLAENPLLNPMRLN